MKVERLSDFKLGMVIVIKADKDWSGIGRLQVAMHSRLLRFIVEFISWCVMYVVIKAENDWHDVRRSQVVLCVAIAIFAS